VIQKVGEKFDLFCCYFWQPDFSGHTWISLKYIFRTNIMPGHATGVGLL
jgi:hypothetical protein